MKAKSKVLLGLLVALAMMVFAVPAFAASATFTATFTPESETTAYTGKQAVINVAITDAQNPGADDTYDITATDKTTIPAGGGDAIATKTIHLMGQDPSGNLKLAVGENAYVGEHNIEIKVSKTGEAGKGDKTYSYKVNVKKNLNATISDNNLDKEEELGVVTGLTRSVKAGDPIEVFVTRGDGSEEYSYQWQIAPPDADVSAAALIDPKNSDFVDITGETNAKLEKIANIDDNGSYVRCIVKDSAGNEVVASHTYGEGAEQNDIYCVKLDVEDLNLVCTSPTEDQNVTVIMTQTKALTVAAKGGQKDYTYRWKKDGDYLQPTSVTEGPTLTIKGDADKEAAGDYVCEITDKRHQTVTSPVFHVTVADMPTLVLDPSVVTTQKAQYDEHGDAQFGAGETFITKEQAASGIDFKAVIENPAEIKTVQWLQTGKSEWQTTDTTFHVDGPIKDGTIVTARVEFKDLPGTTKILTYTTTIYVTDGTLDGGIYTYTSNTDTPDIDPEYTIVLPSKKYWAKGFGVGQELTEADGFDINLPVDGTATKGGANVAYKAIVSEAAAAKSQTLRFKVVPTNEANYPVTVEKPYVKNMTVKINSTGANNLIASDYDLQTTYVGTVALPVSNTVGYKIMRATTAADLDLKVKTTPYNAKEQPAEVIGANDAKIGEVSEVRYIKEADAKDYVDENGGKYKIKGDLTEKQMNAFLKALKSDAPVDADKYLVVCNVADSDEYAAAKNLLVPTPYTITKATKGAVEKSPTTYFDWTKEKVYNGQEQEPDVKFADGMEDAGKITKVSYKTTDKNGALVDATPKSVGVYKIYVSTETTAEDGNVDELDNAYIGEFAITKLPVTADLFKMDPTEADYTGNPIVPTITTETPGVGAIEAVHYYAEGSQEELGSAPVKAGKYTVKIDVAEGENYRAEKGVEVGTLTIKSQETHKPTMYARGHVQNIGWEELETLEPGTTKQIGTTGRSLRVEAIDIIVPENYTVGGFAHIQNKGDTAVTEVPADDKEYPANVPEGYKVYRYGTTGQSLRLESIQLEIKDASGAMLQGLQYETHVQNKAWQGFVDNGSWSGTKGLSLRLEALRFAYEGNPAPADTPQAPATPETPATPAE